MLTWRYKNKCLPVLSAVNWTHFQTLIPLVCSAGILRWPQHCLTCPTESTPEIKIRIQAIQCSEHSQARQDSAPGTPLDFGTSCLLLQIQALLEWLDLMPPKTEGLTNICTSLGGGTLLSSVTVMVVFQTAASSFLSLWGPPCGPAVDRHLILYHWHKPALLFPECAPHT